MIEKLDNCPVCDKPLSQGGYDMQTCGTHFVAGKIRNHRKPSPVLPGEPLTEWQIDEIAKGPATEDRMRALIGNLRLARRQYQTLNGINDGLIADAKTQRAIVGNLARMLHRFIYDARKQTGDTSAKVLAGKAGELLTGYGLQGSILRDD